MMTNLNQAKAGKKYMITRILGELADSLRNGYNLSEATCVKVLQKLGNGHVIISYGDHKLAMNGAVAGAVGVQALE